MSKRRFKRLRIELEEADLEQRDLAPKLTRGETYISNCITGKRSWSLWEAYETLRLLGIPIEQIGVYFPPEDVPPPVEMAASRKGAKPA